MQNLLPVLIIGAGPTGLTAALELNRYDIPFRIIDKQIKPVVHSNALAVQTRTLYAWEAMGLLPEALSKGKKITGLNLSSNNKKLAHISLDLLEGDKHYILGLSQHETEKMLLERLREKNITVEMEVTVVDLQEQENHTTITLQNKDGLQETIQAQWLLACDGAHSFVREKLNIPFTGKKLKQHFVLADAQVQSELTPNEGHFFISDKGVFLFIQFSEKYSRIIVEVSDDPALKTATSLTFEEVKALAEKLCPVKLTIQEPIWTSGFWIHESMIDQYRHHRVFFLGDAAHIHSPAGGQGMNTGIQDAYNIAWKLAYVLQKKAKSILLDTYQAERQQIAKQVLRRTTVLTNVITTHHYFLKKIRNFFIFYFSKIPFFQKKMINTLAQLNITYSNSLLVKDCLPWQSGPKAGTFKAGLPPQLSALMNPSSFVLLLFSGKINQPTIWADFKNTFKYAHSIQLIYISEDVSGWDGTDFVDTNLAMHNSFDISKPSLYLIRPDQYIGFRGELKHKNALENYFTAFSFN